MKQSKMAAHGLTALAVIALVFMSAGSAATVPAPSPVVLKTYEMAQMPGPDLLKGKSDVVFDLAMAEKVLPKQAKGTSGGGGLGGALLGAAGNAADLSNFNKAADSEGWLAQEQTALIRKQPALYEAFSAEYRRLNNAETTRAAFDFSGATPSIGYFSKADAGVKAKITAACAEHNADYAVDMVGQLVHDETMNAAPISAPAVINVEVCLFDKTGVSYNFF
jgi:hypothetical protein